MITYEQELTLLGGWARAQIPQPIELGVEKISVTPSASIYISEIYYNKEWSDQRLKAKQLECVSILPQIKGLISLEKGDFYIEVEYASIDPMTRQEVFRGLDLTQTKEKPLTNSDYGTAFQWIHVFHRTWVDRAFLRFFEIWQKGTADDIQRGLAGKHHLRKSLSGMIGGNYNGGHAKQLKPLTKLGSGQWALSDDKPLYPGIPRLPPSGIQAARMIARQLQKQRQKKN